MSQTYIYLGTQEYHMLEKLKILNKYSIGIEITILVMNMDIKIFNKKQINSIIKLIEN